VPANATNVNQLEQVADRYNQNSDDAVQIVIIVGSTTHRIWVHIIQLRRLPGLLEHLCQDRPLVEAKNSPGGIVTSIADGDPADKFKLRIKVGARGHAVSLPPTPNPQPPTPTCARCCSALAAGSAALAAGPALLPVAPHWLLAPRQPTPAPPPPLGAPRPRSTRCRRRCGSWA
jgi:hypothetical protein